MTCAAARRAKRAGMSFAERELERAKAREYIRANKERVNFLKSKRREQPSYVTRSLISLAKRRARDKNLPFSLSSADIEEQVEKRVCAATGIPFNFVRGEGRSPFSPSIHRIKPELGYVRGNVEIVLWALNAMRGDWGDDVIFQIANALAQRLRAA